MRSRGNHRKLLTPKKPRAYSPRRAAKLRGRERERGMSGSCGRNSRPKRNAAVNHDLAAAISFRPPAARRQAGAASHHRRVLPGGPLFKGGGLTSWSLVRSSGAPRPASETTHAMVAGPALKRNGRRVARRPVHASCDIPARSKRPALLPPTLSLSPGPELLTRLSG
jgi:hypothetical protein